MPVGDRPSFWNRFRLPIYVSIFPFTLLMGLTLLSIRVPRADQSNAPIEPEKGETYRKPAVRRVLVVIIDGLGANVAFQPGRMPHFQMLASKGALGTAQASFPTMTTTVITSIVSGRHPPPGMGFPGGLRPEHQYDSVISRAHAAGLKVYVVGQQDWDALFGGHGARMAVIPYRGKPIQYDSKLVAQALRIMKDRKKDWNLIYLHLFDLDPTGHVYGTLSPEYHEKLDWLDGHLETLIRAAGPEAVVVITADHGQTEDGTHGGLESAVRNVPLLFLGARVRPGRFGTVGQQDVAATVAALLGASQPALSIGYPIYPAFDLSPRERAERALDTLRQRARKWAALRSSWPWILGNPTSQIEPCERLLQKGKAAQAESIALKAARRIDLSLEELSPNRWFGRSVLGLGLLALASAFSMIWPQASARVIVFTACLAGIRLNASALPLYLSALAPGAMLAGLFCSIGMLALSLLPGWKQKPSLSRASWLIWWLAVISTALPQIIDLNLWAWWSVWTLCLVGSVRSVLRDRGSARAALLLAAALAAATIITTWIPSTENSVLRSLLPAINLRRYGMPSWTMIETAIWPLIALYIAAQLRALKPTWVRLVVYICGVFLIAGSLFAAHIDHQLSEWTWFVAALSIPLFFFRPGPPDIYGLWLSMLSLIFCHTLIAPREFCMLGLATLAGWGLHGLRRPESDLWLSAEIWVLALWSYLAVSGTLSVSTITVGEVYTALGHQWHPRIMVALLMTKHLALALGPTLPLLSALRWRSLPGIFPFLGSLAVGNLAILWFEQSYMGLASSNIVNEPSYEMLLWSIFFGWSTLLTWIAVHGSQRAALRLFGPQGLAANTDISALPVGLEV